MPDFTIGQDVIWSGLSGRFTHRAVIKAVRQSYLMIFGETPADARTVYDIDDLVTKVTVLSIPGEQLRNADV